MSLARIAPDQAWISDIASSVAHCRRTSPRALRLALLLHLPRLADADGRIELRQAWREANRLAVMMPNAARWTVAADVDLAGTTFAPLDLLAASALCRDHHYLGSARVAGDAFAMFSHAGDPVAFGVVVDCDVLLLEDLAERRWRSQRPRVLARVFAFEGTPKNTLTRLFSRIAAIERQRGTDALLTYVNPNLGFDGVSYRAGSWSQIGIEAGTTYRYVDCRYTTDRELKAMTGSDPRREEAAVADVLGDRYRRSLMSLAPLLVYGRSLERRTKVAA